MELKVSLRISADFGEIAPIGTPFKRFPDFRFTLQWLPETQTHEPMCTILILFHSPGGNVANMAQQVARGVDGVQQCESVIRTVPPITTTTSATDPAIPASGPAYASLDDLAECDGLALGSPTHFGNMSGALKHFIDGSTAAWLNGALSGKPAGVFTSTGSMHGGQESTLLSMMLPLMHHGMVLVGIPYSEKALSKTTRGGTPYGASHVSGNNGDQPLSDDESTLCRALGQRVANCALALQSSNLRRTS